MKQNSILAAFLLLNTFFIFSCSSDVAEQEAETVLSLVGEWELKKGFRNGKEAVTLAGTSFEFRADSTMVYNLAGAREAVDYEIDEMTITPLKSRLEAIYSIEELTDSTLILTTSIRNTPFRFELGRVVLEE